jgi:hypothetical protein
MGGGVAELALSVKAAGEEGVHQPGLDPVLLRQQHLSLLYCPIDYTQNIRNRTLRGSRWSENPNSQKLLQLKIHQASSLLLKLEGNTGAIEMIEKVKNKATIVLTLWAANLDKV